MLKRLACLLVAGGGTGWHGAADDNWHGFLEGLRQMIRGIGEYMNYVGP